MDEDKRRALGYVTHCIETWHPDDTLMPIMKTIQRNLSAQDRAEALKSLYTIMSWALEDRGYVAGYDNMVERHYETIKAALMQPDAEPIEGLEEAIEWTEIADDIDDEARIGEFAKAKHIRAIWEAARRYAAPSAPEKGGE